MVPEAGLGQVSVPYAVSNAHPQFPRHQRHAASKLSNIPIVRHFRRYVKTCYYAATNHLVLRNYPAKTRSLALSLALFRHFFCSFQQANDRLATLALRLTLRQHNPRIHPGSRQFKMWTAHRPVL
jgi:hypothetical protein